MSVTRKEFEDLEKRVTELEKNYSMNQHRGHSRPQSVTEFVITKNPNSEIEKAVCLVYFHEEISTTYQEGFTSRDLTEGFKEAREKVPGNISDVIGRCAKKGWFSKVGTRDNQILWRLTNSGVAFVEELDREELDRSE